MATGKSTAPGVDGITCDVIRFLNIKFLDTLRDLFDSIWLEDAKVLKEGHQCSMLFLRVNDVPSQNKSSQEIQPKDSTD